MDIKEQIEIARAAVNAAVAPYGFHAERCMDELLAELVGEAWFILESGKPHKDFFEACYYITPPKHGRHSAGDVIYGVMGPCAWEAYPADPAAACAKFQRENERISALDKIFMK